MLYNAAHISGLCVCVCVYVCDAGLQYIMLPMCVCVCVCVCARARAYPRILRKQHCAVRSDTNVSRLAVDKHVFLSKVGGQVVEIWDKKSDKILDLIDCAQFLYPFTLVIYIYI